MHKQRDDIESVQRRIRSLADKGISKKLEEVQRAINNLKNQIEEIRRKKEEASREIDDIKNILANQQARERELEDNLKYRQKTEEAYNLRKELAELENKFGNLNYEDLKNRKENLKREEERIIKQVCEI